MCKECGCDSDGEVKIDGVPSSKVKSPITDDARIVDVHAHNTGDEHIHSGDKDFVINKQEESEEGHQSARSQIDQDLYNGEQVHSHKGDQVHSHADDYAHSHNDSEEHSHNHTHLHKNHSDSAAHTIQLNKLILEKNERLAERNRGYFLAKGVFAINMLSSPGSGKTTLIIETAKALSGRLRTGVVVGDLATQNDAERIRAAGVPAVQINTSTVCHLDAEMVAKAVAQLPMDSIDLLIIENVGNLVCPSMFDLGEEKRVVLLSATEGEDKPLKYPPLFHTADVAIITKIDLAEAVEFNRGMALQNLKKISHHARIFEVSAKRGDGMKEWCEFLIESCKRVKR